MVFDFTKEPGKKRYNRTYLTDGIPLVSVVTPYYNAGKYFKRLYPCVLNQTFPWFEWIIVDDGSTNEEDRLLLASLEGKDSRIKVVHKENGGISSARNRGIRESSAEIIITLDADELIEPTYFEVLYWALYYNPDCAWAYTDSVGFQNQEYVWQYPFDSEKLKTYNFLVESAAIRKKDLLEVGCYDEVEKHYYEDWRLWLKLLSKSKKPVKVSSLEFWYRRTDSGVLNKVNSDTSVKKRADSLIREAAKTADTTVTAKTFHGYWEKDAIEVPIRTDFQKAYFQKKNKTHILFLIPHMVMGGADQFNLDFVKLLDKEKYEISILSTEPSENEWKQRFREYTPEVLSLPDFLDAKNYAEFISYIIETRQIDICLISNSYYAYYLVPWLRIEYPDLAIIDYVHMEEMYWRKGGYARISAAISEIIEKTYVCNNATREVFINRFGRKAEDVETIYIGVDYRKFDPCLVEYGKVRETYHISDQEKIILFPCRLHEQKRPYLMVEIAKEVIGKNPDIRFLVVGDGSELEGTRQKAIEYGLADHMIFAGAQTDMLPFYRDSDLTLICSIREGLSLTAYESCSMETPVVTADVGGQKELIDHTVGRVVPLGQAEEDIAVRIYSPEEVGAYAEAILDLLSPENKQEYEKMCSRCRDKIISAFGLDTMSQRMEDALVSCQTEQRREARKAKSEALKVFSKMAAELYTTYFMFESKAEECEQIWRERCWFEQQCGNMTKGNGILNKILKVRSCIAERGIRYTCRRIVEKIIGY